MKLRELVYRLSQKLGELGDDADVFVESSDTGELSPVGLYDRANLSDGSYDVVIYQRNEEMK